MSDGINNTLLFGHILSKGETSRLTRVRSQNSTLIASKVEILSKVENTQLYSKCDQKIIGHLKKNVFKGTTGGLKSSFTPCL